ncbi:hypothetical protein [Actinophytocola gossypii]|uniref:Uncharacterized protein n=1 Tax=Actinophytocola gossypii TaxID=2812003 RepID=A0ABT2JK41_9PSEU|nr:hypothetical protein [Actinophytocola gossypii]MCT2588252.1 hypothetical protein [Actinophytocola gossypii]
MRDAAAAQAVDNWNEYAAVVHGTPQHLPWNVFADRVRDAEKAAPRPKRELEKEALDAVLADLDLADIDAAEALKTSDPDAHAHFLDRSRKELETVDAAWQASTYTIEQARAAYTAQPCIAGAARPRGLQGLPRRPGRRHPEPHGADRAASRPARWPTPPAAPTAPATCSRSPASATTTPTMRTPSPAAARPQPRLTRSAGRAAEPHAVRARAALCGHRLSVEGS